MGNLTNADTGRAPRLPAIPTPSTEPRQLLRFMEAVKEFIEVHGSGRASSSDKFVTFRDLDTLGIKPTMLRVGKPRISDGEIPVAFPGGGFASISVADFANALFSTRLYQDLVRRLDDPARFDGLPAAVRNVLLKDIAAEARSRGADIRRLEQKIQTAEQSLAMVSEEVTAATESAMAGVRETVFAYADQFSAAAGKVTQVQARLDNFDGGTATIEETMIATADRTSGLAAEYMVKLNAGRAVAGFGLAASEDPSGDTESAFIVQADMFALTSTYTYVQEATPSATAIGQTWYKPSTKVSYRATATGTANWVVYTPVVPFGVDTTTGTVYINGQVRIATGGGTALEDVTTGLDAVGFTVAASTLAFQVTRAGTGSPTSLTFTHTAQNLPTNLRVRYTSSPSITGFNGVYYNLTDSPSMTYANLASALGTANTATVTATLYNPTGNNTPYESGGTGFVEQITLVRLYEGSGAVQATVSNSTHTFTANSAGTVATYSGSGTQIRVYEGTTELTYDGVGTANGTWKVTTSASGITTGSLTDSGTYLTVGDHSAMTGDTASITYTVSGKDRLGNSFSFPVTQTFAKGKAGTTGADGERGSLTGYGSGSSWSDTTARNTIWTLLGNAGSAPSNAHLRIGDTVTISNGTSFAATKYWSGTGWLDPGVVIDGNLLVNGTVSATKITAGQADITAGAGRIYLGEGPYTAKDLMMLRKNSTSNGAALRVEDQVGGLAAAFTVTGYSNAAQITVTNGGSTGATLALNGSNGTGLQVSASYTTAGITVANSGTGFGMTLGGNSTKAPLKLDVLGSLPTDRTAGSVCFYGGWLCFANGSHWFQSDGTQLT